MSVSSVAMHDYHEVTWRQDGYGVHLFGRAGDVSTLVAIARSVG